MIQCYDKFSYQKNNLSGFKVQSSVGSHSRFLSMQSEYERRTSALDLGLAEFKAKKQKI